MTRLIGKKLSGLLAAACLLMAPIMASAADAEAPPRVLRAAYVTSLSFSPLYLALAKGYLEEQNIDLQLQIVQSSSDTVAFLGRGQLDLAFGNIGDSLFNALSRGVDVKIVAGMSYYPEDPDTLSPVPILASKPLMESGKIKTVADLKGRPVGFNTRGGVIEYLAQNGLQRAGLTVDDINIVRIAFPDMIVALSNQAIDAALMPEPLSTLARKRGVAKVLVPNPAPGTLATVLLFGSNMLKPDQAELANDLLHALRRAANELQTPAAIMSPQNVQIWSKYTKVPAAVIADTAPYVFAKDLALDVDDLMKQQQYLLDSGRIEQAVPAKALVAEQFAKRK